jgi:hypothetical protein
MSPLTHPPRLLLPESSPIMTGSQLTHSPTWSKLSIPTLLQVALSLLLQKGR